MAPTKANIQMIVGGEDRVEAMLLLIGEQPDSGADRFTNPVQVITRPSSTSMELGLEASPRLIELRTDQGDHVEGMGLPSVLRANLPVE